MEKENSFNLDFIRVLFNHRKSILICFLIVIFATAIVSLIIPEWYRAYATILPPTEESGLGNFTSLLSDMPLRALGLGSGVTGEAERVLAILESRSLMESVCREFDLVNKYRKKNIEETIKELRKHAGVRLEDEGTITVFIEASAHWFAILNPKKRDEARSLTRDMTNYYVRELDRLNKKLKTSQAGNMRAFIERRYHQNREDLHTAEEKFKAFQQKYGAVDLTEQMVATITTAAEIKAQVLSKEIEVNVLENYVGGSHSELQKAKNELKELKNQYDDMMSRKDSGPEDDTTNADSQDLFFRLEEVPDIGLRYARLYREVIIQEKIMEFLLPQYEQAKIQEARDTPTVQVLDEAVIPVKKHRPLRALIVIFLGMLSLICSSLYWVFKPSVTAVYDQLRN